MKHTLKLAPSGNHEIQIGNPVTLKNNPKIEIFQIIIKKILEIQKIMLIPKNLISGFQSYFLARNLHLKSLKININPATASRCTAIRRREAPSSAVLCHKEN